ncbi:MAG: hypothetical protein JNK04_02405 [Myxococcales bacterium]|nr:hypothetical protein [Myxococcales bacterium]
MSTRLLVVLPLLLAAAPALSVRADGPPTASAEITAGERDLGAAKAFAPNEQIDRRTRAGSALVHFATSFELEPTWQAAAGALDAELLLGSSAAASAWYWLAADRADYSDAYLAWQKAALARVFDGRAAFTFEFPATPQSMHVDGVPVPAGGAGRPLALDVGAHKISASTVDGDTHQSIIEVTTAEVGGRHFYPLAFKRHLRAGEVDPDLPQIGPRPPEKEDMGALQLVTIITTVALASGIAVGGGYLLFGEDNPRGIDTPEGAAIIATELALIGGGTAIALISD